MGQYVRLVQPQAAGGHRRHRRAVHPSEHDAELLRRRARGPHVAFLPGAWARLGLAAALVRRSSSLEVSMLRLQGVPWSTMMCLQSAAGISWRAIRSVERRLDEK